MSHKGQPACAATAAIWQWCATIVDVLGDSAEEAERRTSVNSGRGTSSSAASATWDQLATEYSFILLWRILEEILGKVVDRIFWLYLAHLDDALCERWDDILHEIVSER